MHLIGIPLHKPSPGEFTAAVVMGVGLWVAAVGVALAAQLGLGRADAGALLIVIVWACVGARMGIDMVAGGGRHLGANLLVSAGLLAVYQVILACVL